MMSSISEEWYASISPASHKVASSESSGICPSRWVPDPQCRRPGPAGAKDVDPGPAMRADRVAHVLHQADQGDPQMLGHAGCLAHHHTGEILRRGYQNNASQRQGLGHRQGGVRRSGRQVDDQEIEFPQAMSRQNCSMTRLMSGPRQTTACSSSDKSKLIDINLMPICDSAGQISRDRAGGR
jgi:hypothetical protein